MKAICSRCCFSLLTLLMTGLLPVSAQAADAVAEMGERSVGIVRMGPPTPDTCFWTEREFTDLPEYGPRMAKGLILWNHGQDGAGRATWHRGAPPIIRLFADDGWDVVLLQRNERCQGSWPRKGGEYVANLRSQVELAKKRGYRKILVAGQSFGAGTALGVGETVGSIDGVLAFALSHGRGACRAGYSAEAIKFHQREIEYAIDRNTVPRVLISMGKNDHCEGHTFTPMISSALAQKELAYIHFDESMEIPGHSAATTREFSRLYGKCVKAFFESDEHARRGRHVCDPLR